MHRRLCLLAILDEEPAQDGLGPHLPEPLDPGGHEEEDRGALADGAELDEVIDWAPPPTRPYERIAEVYSIFGGSAPEAPGNGNGKGNRPPGGGELG